MEQNYNDKTYIEEITLKYLLNKDQKNKLLYSHESKKINKKEKKFYRRRILNLTREMLLNTQGDDMLNDVKESFNAYVRTCIGYFKVKDETDLLQEEHISNTILDEVVETNLDIDDIVTPEEADKLMMRTIKINNLPLDKFVKIKYLKEEMPVNFPLQKNINLLEPSLKNKGIRKKNNLHNTYNAPDEKKT